MSPERHDRAVGDHVHVAATGLVEVVAAGRGDIGDRRGHRHGDAQHRPGGVRGSAAEPDQDAGRAGTHQVQRRLVRGAAADDDRHVQLVDELLQVERLELGGDVLGGHRGAADDEEVDAGVHHRLRVRLGVLRRQRAGGRHSGFSDLRDPLADQLGLDRLGVDLLHPAGRLDGSSIAMISSSSGCGSS